VLRGIKVTIQRDFVVIKKVNVCKRKPLQTLLCKESRGEKENKRQGTKPSGLKNPERLKLF